MIERKRCEIYDFICPSMLHSISTADIYNYVCCFIVIVFFLCCLPTSLRRVNKMESTSVRFDDIH